MSPSVFASCHTEFAGEVSSPLLFPSVQVLLEKQKEKNSLSETLLQTRGQLSQACQQVQQLRQEVKEQQEKGQVSLSRQGTECRAVARAQKAGAGSEEARAASGPGSTEPGKLQSSGPGRKACNGSRAG